MSDPELQTAKDRLTRFAGGGESGFKVYPGGIFCLDAPNPFYVDLRLLLASLDALEAEAKEIAAHGLTWSGRAESAEAQRDKLAGEVQLLNGQLDGCRLGQERTLADLAAAEARLSALSVALAEMDRVGCPLDGGKSFDRCPKCHATAAQNCGRWVTAVSDLEKAVRAALNPTLPTGGEGKAVGWQYRLSQEAADQVDADALRLGRLPLGRRWILALYPTREDAERAAYGNTPDRPPNEVRPLFAAPSKEPRQPSHAKILLESVRALRNSAADHHDWSSILTADERAGMIAEAEALEAGAAALGHAILSELSNEGTQSSWRSIETAPRDGTHIILAFGQDHSSEGWWEDDDNESRPWCFIDMADFNEAIINRSRDGEYGPTHWQPMPYREPRNRPSNPASNEGIEP